ncbi:hypothetical protein ACOSP7_019129 [Xanthoceras sorbifolium]
MTATAVIDLEELEAGMTSIVEGMRSTDQVSDAVPSMSRPLRFLPVNLLTESDLLWIRFQYGMPEFVELRSPTPVERPDLDIPGWTCLNELPFRQGLRFLVPFLSH